MKTPSAALAKPKPVSSGLFVSLAKLKSALERQRVALVQVLLLQAVVAVEAGLHRVAADDLRQADRHVLRRVGVEERRIRAGSAARVPMRLPHGNVGASSARPFTKNGGATSSITGWLYDPSGRMLAFGIQLRQPAAGPC